MTEGGETPDGRGARIAAVVAAAGLSSRMGAFKPLLPFAGTTVVGRVVGALKAAGIDEIVVVVGHRADELAPQVAALGVRSVLNPDYMKGMYTSLAAGIAALADDVGAAMILPVDVPSVRIATLRRIRAAAARRTGWSVVHPTFRGRRGHPPIVDRALFAEILAGDGVGGLGALLARHEAASIEVPVFDRGTLLDMDRPADHVRLAARVERLEVPDADECEAMLAHLEVAEPIRRHCRAVAVVAEAIAAGLVDAGLSIDRGLVAAAARLHDLAKGRAAHAELAGRRLAAWGFPEVGRLVGAHMRLAFADGDSLDARVVVHLADKLVRETRPVSLATRFATIAARFGDDPAARAGAEARRRAAEAMAAAVERVAPGLLTRATATLAEMPE